MQPQCVKRGVGGGKTDALSSVDLKFVCVIISRICLTVYCALQKKLNVHCGSTKAYNQNGNSSTYIHVLMCTCTYIIKPQVCVCTQGRREGISVGGCGANLPTDISGKHLLWVNLPTQTSYDQTLYIVYFVSPQNGQSLK